MRKVIALAMQGLLLWALMTPIGANAAPPVAPNRTAGSGSTSSPTGTTYELNSGNLSHESNAGVPVSITTGGSIAADGTVTGGTARVINPGQSISASEYLAVHQILNSGRQHLLVSDTGVAMGGYATLSPSAISTLSSLHLPGGVSLASIGYGASNPFNVTGNATIGGNFYALQTAPNIASVLNFGSLTILPGGTLSGHLPTDFSVAGTYASALKINVAGNLINQSLITAPDAVSITTGGTLFNQSTGGSTATISTGALSIFSGSGLVVNSGLMSATSDLDITTSAVKSLLVNNTNGILKATNELRFRDAAYTGTAATKIIGGDMEANQIRLFGGHGAANIDSQKIDGKLSVCADTVHVRSNTDTLVLGGQVIYGDPTYYNGGGDIIIDGDLTFNAPVAILATGNITTGGSPIQRIVTNGNPITLVAGAASITPSPGGGGTTTGQGGGDTTTAFTVASNNPANTGGFIDLTTGNGLSQMDSSSGAGAGGNITLVAMGTSAFIRLPGGLTLTSGGSGANAAGNVTMMTPGNIETVGPATGVQVNTVGGTGGGNVSIYNANPTGSMNISAGGAPTNQFTVGALTTGNTTVNNMATNNGAKMTFSSNGVKTLNSPTWDLQQRQILLSGAGPNIMSATAGDVTFGSTQNQILNTGSGFLTILATNNIDFGQVNGPIDTGSMPINSNATTVVHATNQILLNRAGTLNLRSLGAADGSFLSGIALVGDQGVVMPGGGSTLNINFSGNGGSLYDLGPGAGFSGINATTLRINSAGDIHLFSHSFNNLGGSIALNVPASGFFGTAFDVDQPGTATFSNIASNGSLNIYTYGLVDIFGTITNGGAPAGLGGIQIVAGDWCVACPNTDTGIRLNPGARMLATGQLISLVVANVVTTPPANPAIPLIDIQAGSAVTSTGLVFNNQLSGGGIELNVNVTTSPSLVSLLATRSNLPNSSGYPYPNAGQFINVGGSSTVTPGFHQQQFGGGTGIYLADQGGAVIQDVGAVPNLVSGTGRIYAHGGVVYAGGSSYAGEIRIDGLVTADASVIPPLPPPPPPPPPPPRPLPVIEPPTAGISVPEVNETKGSIIATDTTKMSTTSNSALSNSSGNKDSSQPITEIQNGTTTVVLTACQPFIFGDDPEHESKKDTVAIAAAGTEVARESGGNSVDLKEGKMVVAAGKGGFTVNTSKGVNVVIPENSTAIVERGRNGQVVVTSLTGNATSVRIGDPSTGKTMDVTSGQELAIADDEILIPADAEDQTLQVEATLVVANKNVQKRKFNVEKRIGKERILVCAQGGSTGELNQRLHKKIEQLRNSKAEQEVEKNLNKNISLSDHLLPVAYVTPTAPQKPLGLVKSEETKTAEVRYLRGPKVDYTAANELITIKKGEFVVSAHKATKLMIDEQPFAMKAGSIILVNAKETVTTVSNIYEVSMHSVSGTVHKQKLVLRSGSEVVFNYKGSILHALQQDNIARRALVDHGNSDRHVPMGTCEFSYASLFSVDPLLSKMAKSDHPGNKSIIGKTMKTAAAVSLVTARRGPYAKVNEYNEYDK